MGTDGKINVCHIISGDLWAGAEVQMYTLVKALSTSPGLRISVIVLNEGKLADRLRNIGLDVLVIEESKNGFMQILKLAKNALMNKGIDIIHSHRYKENIIAALIKKKCGIKYLVQTVHGLKEPFSGIKKVKARIYSFINYYFMKKYFDKVQTVSFDIQERLIRKINPDKLMTIHNALDTSDMVFASDNFEVRRELGLKENDRIIGSVGRMVPIKGFDIFLQAARLILNREPEARFILVGDGPVLNDLKSMAKELGISDRVTFPGFRDDVLDIINCLDIFIVSSYYEGIPMAVLEAMSINKVIIATRTGGLKEIIEDNISGIFVDVGDYKAIASACLNVLEDRNLKEKLGEAARKRIIEEFSIDTQKSRVLKLYEELINNR